MCVPGCLAQIRDGFALMIRCVGRAECGLRLPRCVVAGGSLHRHFTYRGWKVAILSYQARPVAPGRPAHSCIAPMARGSPSPRDPQTCHTGIQD